MGTVVNMVDSIKKIDGEGARRHDPGRFLQWGAVVAFLLLEGCIRLFGWYRTVPWVDLPSHFLSGAAVTAVVYRRLSGSEASRRGRAMVGNLIVALAWEGLEKLDEVFTPDPPHLRDIFFWDGFWDVVLALVGGVLWLWVAWRIRGGRSAVDRD
jgi:hypothetical protein